jgi:hypothetical protein
MDRSRPSLSGAGGPFKGLPGFFASRRASADRLSQRARLNACPYMLHMCACERASAFRFGCAVASFIALPARKTINMQRLSNPFNFCDSHPLRNKNLTGMRRVAALFQHSREQVASAPRTEGRTRALGRDRRGLSVLLCRISTLRTAHGRHGRTGRATSKSRATDASHRRSVRQRDSLHAHAHAWSSAFSSVSAALCRKH